MAQTCTAQQKSRKESLYYETQKHSGKLPIMGVNTFSFIQGFSHTIPGEIIRSTEAERSTRLRCFPIFTAPGISKALSKWNNSKWHPLTGSNLFEALMEQLNIALSGSFRRRCV